MVTNMHRNGSDATTAAPGGVKHSSASETIPTARPSNGAKGGRHTVDTVDTVGGGRAPRPPRSGTGAGLTPVTPDDTCQPARRPALPWNQIADLSDLAVDASGAALLATIGFLREWAAADTDWPAAALWDAVERAHDMAERVAAAIEGRETRFGSVERSGAT